MDHGTLDKKTIKELHVICKGDRTTYKGYSKCKRKEDLIEFILSNGIPISEQYEESENEFGESLERLFNELEESNNTMFRDRPTRERIDETLTGVEEEVKAFNPHNSMVFDIHNDEDKGSMYRLYKHRSYKKYNSLGNNGEMILFHGTSEENVSNILNDDFSLTISERHGHRYGKGIYFTSSIWKALSYSGRGDGVKYVIMCLVHVGDTILGTSTMDIHPKMPDSEKRYDTSVDNILRPIQFIKKSTGTYNIIGVLKFNITGHLRNSVRVPPPNRFNAGLHIINTTPEKIELYWIPADTKLYDPSLDIRTVGKYIGIIPARAPRVHLAGSQKFNVQKDHKFVCKNSVGYVRIIEIKNTKEVVKI